MTGFQIFHRPRLLGFLRKPLGKTLAILGGAFLVGVGGYAAARTGSLLDRLLSGGPLEVTVVPTRGGWHPYAPYHVFPPDAAVDPRQIKTEEWYQLEDGLEIDGSVIGSPQLVRISLRSRVPTPIVIHDIIINVHQRREPIRGWFVAGPECGGADVRVADVDLDRDPPRVSTRDFFPSEEEPLVIVVTETDIEILQLQAFTQSSYIEWDAEIVYTGPTGLGTIKVDDQGRPFQVTTEVGSKGYTPNGRRNYLQPVPEWDEGISAC